MAAKIFILAFAAVIWKAQHCIGGPNFPGPFRSSLGSITAESQGALSSPCPSECPSPVTSCFPDTNRCQRPLNPNIACAKFCNPTSAGATGVCTLNECSTLGPMTACSKGNLTPSLPSRGTNLPCTETETALSSEFIRSSCLSPRQPLRPTSCCLQTCSPGLEEASRPSACSVKENLYTKFRPLPQNVRLQFPVYGSANVEASTTVNDGISIAYRGKINPLTSSSATATSEAASSVNIKPNLFSSNTLSGLNNMGAAASTSAYSEAASSASVGSSFAPNIFEGNNNFVTPLSTTATSEAESSANIRSKIFNANELGGFNNFISPVSTAAFSESISSGTSYKPNVFGGYSNFLPATSETTCCTNTQPCACNPNLAGCLNNIPLAISACSESANLGNVGPAYSPCVFGGINNFANPLSAIATSEATSSINNLVPSTCALSNAEATSSVSIEPSKVLPPCLCKGLPDLAIPQNICTMETSQRCCNVELPTSYPTSCSLTNIPNYLPVGTPAIFNSIPPTPCGVLNYISSPCQQSLMSSLNPMVANLCESSASAASSSSSIVSSLEPVTCVPNLPSIIETIDSVPLAEVAASASSTSTSSSTIVTDLNNPNTPCDDESSIVTTTSATSSSSVEVTNVLQNAPEIPSCPIEASTCPGASSTSISVSSASSSSSSASSSSSSTASSSASATSVTSSTSSSVTPSSLNQYQLGISPLTLEVQIPSYITPSSLSCGFYGSATETLSAMNSCKPALSSLPVYELQIPSSIPAQLSCSLESVPSNIPVLCMNLEPVASRMSFSC